MDPFLTHFGTPFLTPFGRKSMFEAYFLQNRPVNRPQNGCLKIGVKKGVQKWTIFDPKMVPFFEKKGPKWPFFDPIF